MYVLARPVTHVTVMQWVAIKQVREIYGFILAVLVEVKSVSLLARAMGGLYKKSPLVISPLGDLLYKCHF